VVVRERAATSAGLHLLVEFQVPWSERELIERAARADVHLDPAGPCFDSPPVRPGALIGFGPVSEPAIRAGIQRLGMVIRQGLSGRRRSEA
jgi:DNA-binding transcriptional MocR family regulator